MPTPETVLNKVKLLLNLANSPNENEAAAAQAMADKLIAKYNITEEELASLAEKPPLYGKDDLLFHTFSLVGWMQRLALTIAKHFYCYIVQEQIHASLGGIEYNYYVYGDDEDTDSVKFVFNAFVKKIHNFVETKCIGRGPIFIESYTEGVVESVRANIEMDGIDIPEVKRPARPIQQSDEKVLNNGQSNLTPFKQQKEAPEKETVDVGAGSLIRDVMAYFKGLEDGRHLSLQDILELEVENEEAKKLAESSTAEGPIEPGEPGSNPIQKPEVD
jgi:hypothetical protein